VGVLTSGGFSRFSFVLERTLSGGCFFGRVLFWGGPVLVGVRWGVGGVWSRAVLFVRGGSFLVSVGGGGLRFIGCLGVPRWGGVVRLSGVSVETVLGGGGFLPVSHSRGGCPGWFAEEREGGTHLVSSGGWLGFLGGRGRGMSVGRNLLFLCRVEGRRRLSSFGGYRGG